MRKERKTMNLLFTHKSFFFFWGMAAAFPDHLSNTIGGQRGVASRVRRDHITFPPRKLFWRMLSKYYTVYRGRRHVRKVITEEKGGGVGGRWSGGTNSMKKYRLLWKTAISRRNRENCQKAKKNPKHTTNTQRHFPRDSGGGGGGARRDKLEQ